MVLCCYSNGSGPKRMAIAISLANQEYTTVYFEKHSFLVINAGCILMFLVGFQGIFRAGVGNIGDQIKNT